MASAGTSTYVARADHDHGPFKPPGLASRVSAIAIANTETVVLGAPFTAAVNRSIRLKAFGRLTSGGTPGSSIFRCRVGVATLAGNIATTLTLANGNTVTNLPFMVEILATIRSTGSSGTVIGNMIVDGGVIGAFTVAATVSATSATVTVNTTAGNIVELTYISGNAGTTATFENAVIELIT